MSDAHRIAVAAARGAAAAVEASRGHLNDLNVYPVPDGDTGSNLAETARELAAGLEAVLAAAAESVVRTQTMLAVLREAGVVDAGAAGLVEFCRGAVAGARGEHIHAPLEAIERPLSLEAVHQEESEYRYCTSFLLEGDAIDRDRLEGQLLAMGDCLLVVGEAPMCRVHLHTDDPGAALTRAVAMGSIDRVAIANMHEQTRRREERLRSAPTLVALPGGRTDSDRLTAENTAVVLDSTADLPHPEHIHPNWR